MMMMTATDMVRGLKSGQWSAQDLVQQSLETIAAHNKALNAVLEVHDDRALRRADDIDQRRAQGEALGLLAGVPLLIKDNICTTWGKTTCGSAALAEYRSPYSAHAVEAVEAADAVVVGKTNLDEFAMGSSTESSASGPTRNPWAPSRVPGGSSGGSAAAVAAGMVPLALGTDTGGSIRQPASFCNVVGLKPSYGRVSRRGLVAFGSSLDQIGPLGSDVRDVALLLQTIAGHDPQDSTCVNCSVPDYLATLDQLPPTLRIGVPAEYFGEGLDPQVARVVQSAIDTWASNGAEILEIHMPHLRWAIACYYVICTAEASSNLARYDGVHYGHRAEGDLDIVKMYSRSRSAGFGTEVRRRIMLGTFALSSGYYDAYYLKASKVRTLLKGDYDAAFEQVDVIASPVSPVPPFCIGERIDDPLAMYLADVYTVSANLAGVCAVSLPCGFTPDGLPVGLQLQAAAFEEQLLLQAACRFQQLTDWHLRRPS